MLNTTTSVSPFVSSPRAVVGHTETGKKMNVTLTILMKVFMLHMVHCYILKKMWP